MAGILAFAGSARKDSLNKQLLALAAGVNRIDLADYELPLYNGDLEAAQGMPANALALKRLFHEHDGFLIACPEYNGSITPLLKNTIDWVSRPSPAEPDLQPFRGKTAALLATSPGALGGIRGLVHVRAILSGIGVLVLPDQLAVPKAHFDEKVETRVTAIVDRLTETTARLHA